MIDAFGVIRKSISPARAQKIINAPTFIELPNSPMRWKLNNLDYPAGTNGIRQRAKAAELGRQAASKSRLNPKRYVLIRRGKNTAAEGRRRDALRDLRRQQVKEGKIKEFSPRPRRLP